MKIPQATYSLLVPCYNAALYIEGFLENLSKLTLAFDEVIFYDDASTDDTFTLLTATKHQVIKGNINNGPGYARNVLAAHAFGSWIHFHDIDDEFSPAFLQLMQRSISCTNVEVIIANADWIDQHSRNPIIKWRYNAVDLASDPLAYLIANPIGIINTMYKKTRFLAAGGFNEQIRCWEDADLHIRLAAAGARFSLLNATVAYSVRHANGISKNQQWCWECRLKFLEGYISLAGEKYKKVIGLEFEKVAYNLIYHNKFIKAIRAFYKSRKCGVSAPNTNNAALKGIKSVTPMVAFLIKAFAISAKSK